MFTWPFEKAPYGSLDWLRREVGRAIELNPDYKTWDYTQLGRVDSVVESGVMQFYYPPPLERREDDSLSPEEKDKDARNRKPHTWSFLRQLETLSLTQGVAVYDAPAGFSGQSGDLIITTGEGRLPIVSDEQLRNRVANDPNEGTPQYASVRAKSSDGSGHQGWEIAIYPAPDKDMTVEFRYTVAPDPLGESNPFPLGGKQHAETVLASCLAVAEEREGSIKGAPVGSAFSRFMQRLSASIHIDKQAGRPTGDGTTWSEEESEADKLRGQIGLFMGFGQSKSGWSEAQRQQVREVQRQGLRRFYVPPPITGRGQAHRWSFLYPIATLNLQAGVYEYDLPTDFGGLDSPLTYAPGENVIYPSIAVVAEQDVRRWHQTTTQADGRPTRAAVRQKASPQTSGTRYELLLWPAPDSDYRLHYRYRVSPGDDLETIHGGSAHMQTIIEACLSAAESMMNKRSRQHEQRFLERLSASISHDQQLQSPSFLGYNGDGSDGQDDIAGEVHRLGYGESGVTYNGVQY